MSHDRLDLTVCQRQALLGDTSVLSDALVLPCSMCKRQSKAPIDTHRDSGLLLIQAKSPAVRHPGKQGRPGALASEWGGDELTVPTSTGDLHEKGGSACKLFVAHALFKMDHSVTEGVL